jgi:hypothetical protein
MDFDLRDLPTREALQEFSMRIPEIDVRATEAMPTFSASSVASNPVWMLRYRRINIENFPWDIPNFSILKSALKALRSLVYLTENFQY